MNVETETRTTVTIDGSILTAFPPTDVWPGDEPTRRVEPAGDVPGCWIVYLPCENRAVASLLIDDDGTASMHLRVDVGTEGWDVLGERFVDAEIVDGRIVPLYGPDLPDDPAERLRAILAGPEVAFVSSVGEIRAVMREWGALGLGRRPARIAD